MCDIPAVSKHLTDISLKQNVDLADDNLLHSYASVSHLEAADELLSVLGDAVHLRVTYQDARCHICLLRQRSADDACSTEASAHVSSVSHFTATSNDNPVEMVAGNFPGNSAVESRSDCNSVPTSRTSLYDVGIQCSKQTDDGVVSPCSDSLCHAFTQQLHCSSSSDASNRLVFNVLNH